MCADSLACFTLGEDLEMNRRVSSFAPCHNVERFRRVQTCFAIAPRHVVESVVKTRAETEALYYLPDCIYIETVWSGRILIGDH